ncbi:MAG: ABC transporter ATP-binding protein [Lachnospiraceae bacterium]|nr:ABC transporter ATP-binding protein [Lachnospiraceae bacterium]MBQ5560373.1 ABC transporter ATP-binding protein [Lachnospiraceae bacterium]
MKLVLKDVYKKMQKQVILNHVNATFESGKIYGIVGRNGSGKTMLFRAMSGLMNTEGEIWLDEKRLGKDMRILPNLGIIIENTEMYPEFSGYTNLKLLANIKKKVKKDEIKNVLRLVGLDPDDNKIVRKYSLGMKQKLAIAQALMEKPDILFLDEPTNGLDDEAVKNFWELLRNERSKGTLILLASHSKEDIEQLADEVYYMKSGSLFKEENNER